MPRTGQSSFSRGEVSPELLGRKNLADYAISLQTARNVEVLQRGGIRNRAGLKFLGPVGKHDATVRLLPFVFGKTDTHLLEFGDEYIRFLRNDAHITEAGVNISAATQADPVALTTSSAHGYATGDEVFLSALGGMTELNNKRFTITVTSTTTFTLQDQVTGTNVDGTTFTAYTSGGTAARIYEIASPFSASELREIKYTQSFDVMFLTHPNHAPQSLKRFGLTNWTISNTEFFPTQASPTGLSSTVNTAGTATVRYVVTAVANGSSEESIAGLSGTSSFTVTGVTKANPAKVTISAATALLQTGHEVELSGIAGMTELNGRRYSVIRVSGTEFELQGVDSTSFNTYSSGGTMKPGFQEATSSKASDDSTLDNTVSWSAVANAFKYIIYRESQGIFGYVGETRDTTFKDLGSVAPDLSDTAPAFRDPFFGPGNNPAAIGGHQQRNVLGGADNSPATANASQTGAFSNFSSASPRRATDAFQVSISSQSREVIRHIVSVNDLLIFTDSSIKRLTSGNQSFTFENISVRGPNDDIGASQAPPILRKRLVLFEDARGGRVYSVEFSFSIDDLDIKDVSIFSPHLLEKDNILEWGGVTLPEPIIYMVMKSGRALALTFNKETDSVDISGWCRWDTDGFFDSVATLRADLTSQVENAYFVVQRTVDGQSVRYIEKLEDRYDTTDIRDSFFVDSGLSFEDSVNLEGVSNTNPAVVTSTGHGLANDDEIELAGIVWEPSFDKSFNEVFPEDLNYRRYKVKNKTANTFELEGLRDGVMVDGSALPTYNSGGKAYRLVTQLSGYEHLKGRTLVGLLDGNVVRNISVNMLGEVTLPRRVARAHIGLPYISDIQTMPLIEEGRGVASGEIKSLRKIFVKVKDSRGMLIGPSSDQLREWPQRQYEKIGAPTQRLTGSALLHPPGQWDRNGAVFIRQKDPLPLTLLEVFPDVELA